MNTETQKLTRFVALDAALLTLALLIPIASHWLSLPLYKFNPMLAVLLAGMLIGRDWRNSLVLAVALPLFSCMATGMPAAPKMLCMVAEYATVVGLFAAVSRRWKVLPAVLVAVLAGKVVYYLLKAVVVAPAVLIGTDAGVQLLAVLLWGGLFALLYRKLQ